VTVLALAFAPVARLACAAVCATTHRPAAASHVHCPDNRTTAAAGTAHWSPEHPGCTDPHAAITASQSARIGTGDAFGTVSRPGLAEPVRVSVHPVRRSLPSIGPPGYDGHPRPLRI